MQRVKLEEQQKIARAEAESIRLQTQQLNQNPKYIELLEAQTKLRAAEGWDGKLPGYMGSSAVPFIQLPAPQ